MSAMSTRRAFSFSLVMCFFMASAMSALGLYLSRGFFPGFLRQYLLQWPVGFAIALTYEWFVVAPVARRGVARLVKGGAQERPVRFVLVLSLLMVTGMVGFMSFFGAFMQKGLGPGLGAAYLGLLRINFPVALGLQLLLVGPSTRLFFAKGVPWLQRRFIPARG